MYHEVIIKAKGDLTDSYEAKIMEKTEGISDLRERMKINSRLSGEAIVEIENKILDTIFISDLDLPLYILAMECLTEALKGCMENMGILREPMEHRLDILRRTTNISVMSRE
jgi:hypothetical protein